MGNARRRNSAHNFRQPIKGIYVILLPINSLWFLTKGLILLLIESYRQLDPRGDCGEWMGLLHERKLLVRKKSRYETSYHRPATLILDSYFASRQIYSEIDSIKCCAI